MGHYYVGYQGGKRELFYSHILPTEGEWGARYAAVTGPFKTKRAALYMIKYGNQNNPHLQCVADAERLSKK